MARVKFIEENNSVKYIKQKKYYRSKIIDAPGIAKINYAVPFRVKFINIGIEAYGPNDVPPIGIAIIGYNNFIL
jgi:hypothetical protein